MSAGPAAVVEETLLVEYFHFALQCFPSRTTTWDAVESAQFWIDAPQLRLTAVTAEVSDQALIVAYPGRYGIRAHVVQTAPLPAGLGLDFAEGLERWLIQVWPLAPDTA
jgi:hypothetical protein